jgi:hypothetical protein
MGKSMIHEAGMKLHQGQRMMSQNVSSVTVIKLRLTTSLLAAMPTTKQSEANAMMWESFITDIRKTRTPDPDFNLAELTAFLLRVGGEVYTVSSKLEELSRGMEERVLLNAKTRETSSGKAEKTQPVQVIRPAVDYTPFLVFVLFLVLFLVFVLFVVWLLMTCLDYMARAMIEGIIELGEWAVDA